ncbi:HGGxSTG domain-containing protein [Sphingomonas sp. ASV193]|uniref:HGGxSTG domain-containing protein n=1 Tax=Sphingomonas sp. ASV193 TaxID=3144405 RepID=UPI0032E8A30A
MTMITDGEGAAESNPGTPPETDEQPYRRALIKLDVVPRRDDDHGTVLKTLSAAAPISPTSCSTRPLPQASSGKTGCARSAWVTGWGRASARRSSPISAISSIPMADHPRNLGPMRAAPRCGARTRSGAPCRSPAIAGKARCRMHGGKNSGAPKGNRNAFRHGAYTKEVLARASEVKELRREIRDEIERVEAERSLTLWAGRLG